MTASVEVVTEEPVFEARVKRSMLQSMPLFYAGNQEINELSHRVLRSIEAATVAKQDGANCLRRALCEDNRYSKETNDGRKIWLPFWRYFENSTLIKSWFMVFSLQSTWPLAPKKFLPAFVCRWHFFLLCRGNLASMAIGTMAIRKNQLTQFYKNWCNHVKVVLCYLFFFYFIFVV